jgi:hypothetical protein
MFSILTTLTPVPQRQRQYGDDNMMKALPRVMPGNQIYQIEESSTHTAPLQSLPFFGILTYNLTFKYILDKELKKCK